MPPAAYQQGYDSQAKQSTRYLARGAGITACNVDASQYLTNLTAGTGCVLEGSPASARFDFSHPKPMDEAEIRAVEDIANAVLLQNTPVVTKLMAVDEAIESGARALFGEKLCVCLLRSTGRGHDVFRWRTGRNGQRIVHEALIRKRNNPATCKLRVIHSRCGHPTQTLLHWVLRGLCLWHSLLDALRRHLRGLWRRSIGSLNSPQRSHLQIICDRC